MSCLTPKVCVLTALVLSSFNARVSIAQQKKTQTEKVPSVYQRISDSVVTIVVSGRDGAVLRSGSGVILSSDGTIVTNYHVVEGGTFFDVYLSDMELLVRGAIYTPPGAPVKADPVPLPARPIKCAENSDLAALRVTSILPLEAVRISSSLGSVGTKVLAVGSPYGLEGTLSEGIISQVRQTEGSTFIQTTAAISPGSSGGGLFLENGELIGITTMSIRGGQGLNFAIPAQSISRLQPCGSFPVVSAASASQTDTIRIFPGYLSGKQYLDMDEGRQRAYAGGVINGMLAAPYFDAPERATNWLHSCIRHMSDVQVAAILTKYVRDNPETWHYGMVILSINAINTACRPRP